MSIKIVEKIGDVKIYGTGLLGGKGDGLVKINECSIPKAHKLTTRVLTTAFYDHFISNGGKFEADELDTLASILTKFGDIPISVRSSATNEAIISNGSIGSVHAGENTSFMLPNNHDDFSARFNQFIKSIYFIYTDFLKRESPASKEKMAIVINPIPGLYDYTMAGPVYYPLVSGVANSYFPYALQNQQAEDGFARIALGHGYATVLDDFPVISMVTIREPIPFNLLGERQTYFYAIDLSKNITLQGSELETIKKLHARFSTSPAINLLGKKNEAITFESLINNTQTGFKAGLLEIMEMISANISAHFQIEFVFNFESETDETSGKFHVVQLTQLPEFSFEPIEMPTDIQHTYLAIDRLQGHGIKTAIRSAVVVSPFIYAKDKHDLVKAKISDLNKEMKTKNEDYILIAPGRLGSKNRQWGIQIEYWDVDKAAAIFEYGVDIAGRPEPVKELENMTGGIYGSHFLYMIQGGLDEEQKRLQTRMYGTQGTHFLTNLMSNNVIYGFIAPAKDYIDPWFFSPTEANEPVYMLKFPTPVSVYADSKSQICRVIF